MSTMSNTQTTTSYARGERKRRPSHPGLILRELTLPKYGMSQTELAQRIGVSRRTVNMICMGTRPVTVDLALRLAHCFGVSEDFWLRLQQAVDVWEAKHNHEGEYRKIAPVERESVAA